MLRRLRQLSRFHGRDIWLLVSGSKWVAAGALIFDETGRLLLIRHRWRKAWEYPVGMADGSESPLEAARREVFEEVGLQIDHLSFVGVDFFHRRTPNGNLVFTYAGQVAATQAAALNLDRLESTGFRWVTRDEALELISGRLKHRLAELLQAYDDASPVYLENGSSAHNSIQ